MPAPTLIPVTVTAKSNATKPDIAPLNRANDGVNSAGERSLACIAVRAAGDEIVTKLTSWDQVPGARLVGKTNRRGNGVAVQRQAGDNCNRCNACGKLDS